jgi:hypothetical protein
MFALGYAQRYLTQVGGIVLLDSMHPHQQNAFAGTDRFLAVVPTLARMGLARVVSDPKEGKPTTQAAQFVRDVDEMPAELNRAATLRASGTAPWPSSLPARAPLQGGLPNRTTSPRCRATAFTVQSPARPTSRSSMTSATRPDRAAPSATSSGRCRRNVADIHAPHGIRETGGSFPSVVARRRRQCGDTFDKHTRTRGPRTAGPSAT